MMNFRDSLTSEELKEYPLSGYEGRIIVIDKRESIIEAVQKLSKYPFIGFDTETRPSFKKGQRFNVSLLQLSSSEETYLFRLNHTGLTPDLKMLLSSPGVLKVGVAIHDDIKGLQAHSHFNPNGFIELQNLVKDFGITSSSLKKLSAIILGFRISKRQQVSNWENPTLSPAQIVYAATDSWVCHEIYRKLSNDHMRTNEQQG